MIAETVRSVQDQTFTDWECIVVDDGSTDNTKEVIAQIAEEDPRVKYVHQKNAERSVARNNGIAHATGQYICFLDSDDQYCQEYLETLYRFIQSKEIPIGLIVTDYWILTEAGEEPANTPLPTQPAAEWIFDYPITPSRACAHTSILKQFKFREDIIQVEDSVLWVSISTKFPVLFLPKPLIRYRLHGGNSVNRLNRSVFHRYNGLKKFFPSNLSRELSKRKKNELLSDCLWRIAEYYGLNNSYFKSILFSLQSLLTCPIHKHTKAKLFLIWQNIQCLIGMRTSIDV
ncbi:MAG: glycosyltransferase [Flavobacteriales bacterium]|nr:glycosyltransferase [Flavobacteriales bacterium]